jgi:hypothetical protein
MNMKRIFLPLIFIIIIALFSCSCELVGQQQAQEPPEETHSAEGGAVEDSAPVSEETPSAEPSEAPSAEPSEVPSSEPSPEASSEPDNSAEASAEPQGDNPDETASSGEGESSSPEDGSQQTPVDIPASPTGSFVLAQTSDFGQEYIDKMVFLGDSTTYGMKYYAVLKDGKSTDQVWTPSSGTLTLSYQSFATIVYPEDGSEITIRQAVERKKPEYLVITLGVNGVSFMEEDYFKSEYSSLVTDVQSISPETKIILQSIFPVATNYESLKSINNNNISAANGWIQSIAESCGVRYLDTASVLRGDDGWLKQEYQNGDGLHLNETGFNQVLNYIRTHGYQ